MEESRADFVSFGSLVVDFRTENLVASKSAFQWVVVVFTKAAQ